MNAIIWTKKELGEEYSIQLGRTHLKIHVSLKKLGTNWVIC